MLKGSDSETLVLSFSLRRPDRSSPGGTPSAGSAPFSTQAPAPGCPLSAGLQVLVHEHVEFTVHPTTFIPGEK